LSYRSRFQRKPSSLSTLIDTSRWSREWWVCLVVVVVLSWLPHRQWKPFLKPWFSSHLLWIPSINNYRMTNNRSKSLLLSKVAIWSRLTSNHNSQREEPRQHHLKNQLLQWISMGFSEVLPLLYLLKVWYLLRESTDNQSHNLSRQKLCFQNTSKLLL
jgi:hypothetical protein